MGNHVEEAVEGLPSIQTIKVHARMCSQLLRLIVRVSNIFSEIEEARPRCSSGIEALCLLNNGISKAKSLVHQCSESSALYLALTGDVILTRCKKSCNMMLQSLGQIQNMVPVVLAAKISGIIADLRSASFSRDQSEEEAGKILRELIHRCGDSKLDSTEYTTVADIHAVASRLHITSQKSLVIEKRAIRRLHDKICESDQSKKRILVFFLKLLKIYGQIMSSKDQRDNSENGDSFPFASTYQLSSEIELAVEDKFCDNQIDVLTRPVPPEEFICPLSLRLMSDPVVIASGQTYEKTWIQRWFDEGETTCPVTKMKLENLSFTPNTSMRLLILKWCSMHDVSVPDHNLQESQARSLDMSTTSIASLSSSMNDLNLRLDYSNVSLGSSQGSDYSFTKTRNDVEQSHIRDMEFFNEFDSLPWDRKCKAIEDLKLLNQNNDESWSMIPLENLIKQIVRFLKDSHHILDAEALTNGCALLLEVAQKQRNSTKYINEDTCVLLASLLDTEVSLQALSILEVLSAHQNSDYKIANSGALLNISNLLESQIREYQEPAFCILANLYSNRNLHSLIDPSTLIPKLIPFLEDDTFSRYSVSIVNNMINIEDIRRYVAETDGCVASIVNLLDKDSIEEQEHAVSVLLALCSQRIEYCKVVMDEGVIPGLVSVSINGNDKAKAMAMELLRILRIESDTDVEISEHDVITTDSTQQEIDKNPPKPQGLFKKIFSKQAKKK